MLLDLLCGVKGPKSMKAGPKPVTSRAVRLICHVRKDCSKSVSPHCKGGGWGCLAIHRGVTGSGTFGGCTLLKGVFRKSLITHPPKTTKQVVRGQILLGTSVLNLLL